MLSSIILLLSSHWLEESGFAPLEYLYTLGPGQSGQRGGHLFLLGSILYTNFHEKAHFVKVDVAALKIVAERSS
jgi:hypothetical protein